MKEIELNPNPLVQYLRKPAKEFTRQDIIRYALEKKVEQVNFHYVSGDGKLKTLNFIITSLEYLESILSTGERVDGSSLFDFVDASTSDLYVIPRFRTAFINPFTDIPTIDLLCSYYNKDGEPLSSAPGNILRKAHDKFNKTTKLNIKAFGELEYYIIAPKEINNSYPAMNQRGYHDSKPFVKFEHIRVEALRLIAKCGGQIKYGHSEVGSFTTEDHYCEQHEIEFNPVEITEAAEQIILAKWILRNIAYEYGVDITWAPKISVGKAGSGLHIHYMITNENGHNLMIENEKLSPEAHKSIAGLLQHAKSLTAFGNTVPTSYLRLVPHQEAPTNICWGETNRSALVRVPLGWITKTQMIKDANKPYEIAKTPYIPGKQTVEFRVPDGSADLFHLLAGMVMAINDGFTTKNALEIAQKLKIEVNIFDQKNKHILDKLDHLPASCYESAVELEKDKHFYTKDNIFPEGSINKFIDLLKSYNDSNLSEELYGKTEKIKELVEKYINYA